jgi:hypothetical protein
MHRFVSLLAVQFGKQYRCMDDKSDLVESKPGQIGSVNFFGGGPELGKHG